MRGGEKCWIDAFKPRDRLQRGWWWHGPGCRPGHCPMVAARWQLAVARQMRARFVPGAPAPWLAAHRRAPHRARPGAACSATELPLNWCSCGRQRGGRRPPELCTVPTLHLHTCHMSPPWVTMSLCWQPGPLLTAPWAPPHTAQWEYYRLTRQLPGCCL